MALVSLHQERISESQKVRKMEKSSIVQGVCKPAPSQCLIKLWDRVGQGDNARAAHSPDLFETTATALLLFTCSTSIYIDLNKEIWTKAGSRLKFPFAKSGI